MLSRWIPPLIALLLIELAPLVIYTLNPYTAIKNVCCCNIWYSLSLSLPEAQSIACWVSVIMVIACTLHTMAALEFGPKTLYTRIIRQNCADTFWQVENKLCLWHLLTAELVIQMIFISDCQCILFCPTLLVSFWVFVFIGKNKLYFLSISLSIRLWKDV